MDTAVGRSPGGDRRPRARRGPSSPASRGAAMSSSSSAGGIPRAVRGIVCVDGGIIELADWFPIVGGLPRRAHAAAPRPPHAGRARGADAREQPRAARPRHRRRPRVLPRGVTTAGSSRASPGTATSQIVRSLWEHRPSTRYADARAAHDARAGRHRRRRRGPTAKRRAEAQARAAAPRLRCHWFSPAHHDVHSQYPERVADAARRRGPRRLLRMSRPRLLVIMGSGETAPTMVTPHRDIVARFGGAPPTRRAPRHAVRLPGERRRDLAARGGLLRPARPARDRGGRLPRAARRRSRRALRRSRRPPPSRGCARPTSSSPGRAARRTRSRRGAARRCPRPSPTSSPTAASRSSRARPPSPSAASACPSTRSTRSATRSTGSTGSIS